MARRMRKIGVALFTATLALPSASGLAQQPQQGRESLESRLARVERRLESGSLADMLMQMEQLQKEIRQLRGDIEFQGYAMEDLKRRLQALEKANAAQAPSQPAPTVPEAPAPAEPSVPESVIEIPPVPARQAPSTAADPAAEQTAYQGGFNLLKEGRYTEAINAFRTFLASYPNSSYAGSAQYWLGEAYYASRNFSPAVGEFKKVIERYPGSAKDADARLKMGYAYYELGEWGQARKVLADLTARYPNTTTARLAENRLQRMRSEGR